jgi:tape measure domain-containing protein
MAAIREELEIVDKFSAQFTKFMSLGNQMAKCCTDIGKEIEKMGQTSEKVGDTQKKVFNDSEKAAGGLLNTVKRLAVAVGGIAAIKAGIGLADELTLTYSRLERVNDGLQSTAELQNMIYDAAQRSRGSYVDMMNTASKLKAQTGNTFDSMRQAVAFTELLQKQFKLAGTDAVGISSTMYNLTQALSTGVLRGNDLNIVFSNAPQLVQRIAEHMGVPISQIKKMAEQGQITADIVKNAILSAGVDIDRQFKDMPLTFGDAVQKVRNMAIRGFEPVRAVIANAISSREFNIAANAIGRGLTVAALTAAGAFRVLGGVVGFVSDNIKIIGPAVGILTAAFVGYNAVMAISNAVTAVQTAETGFLATAHMIHASAALAAASGQSVFNAALAACPISWIVAGIALIIAGIAALIMWFHSAAATGHTVFGDIAGVVVGCYSVIVNALAMVANFFISVAEAIMNGGNEAAYQVQLAFYNFAIGAINAFNGVSQGAADAASNIANVFVSAANSAIDSINGIIGALNQIPGFSLGEVGKLGAVHLEGIQISTAGIEAPTRAAAVDLGRLETTSMGDAFNAGFNKGASWGDGVQNSITDGFAGMMSGLTEATGGADLSDMYDAQTGTNDLLGGDGGAGGGKAGVGSVDKVKKVEDCKLSDEDLKIYRDLAERKYLNNIELQTLAPNISVTMPQSEGQHITAQDVADRIKVMLIEQAAAHTAVSHG